MDRRKVSTKVTGMSFVLNAFWPSSSGKTSLVRSYILCEDMLQWTQHLSECSATHGQHLGGVTLDYNAGRTRLILQQRELAEIVPSFIIHYTVLSLQSIQDTLLEDVKLIARLILLYNDLAFLEAL